MPDTFKNLLVKIGKKNKNKQNEYVQKNKEIFKIISSYLINMNKHKLSIIPYSEDQLYFDYGSYAVIFKGTYRLDSGKYIDIVFKAGNVGIAPEFRVSRNIYGKTTDFVLDYFEIREDSEINSLKMLLKIAVFRYFDFNWKKDTINFITVESEKLLYYKVFESLAQIHKANYIHRDLSLGNICFRLVDIDKKQKVKEGLSVDITEKDCCVRIIDLGTALPIEGDAKTDGITQTNIGTAIYWSTGYYNNEVFYYKDDLEALIYCCWDYYNKCHSINNIALESTLPWLNASDLNNMYKIKKQILDSIVGLHDLKYYEHDRKVIIIANYTIPVFIIRLLQYCMTLVKNEKPNYNQIYQIIKEAAL